MYRHIIRESTVLRVAEDSQVSTASLVTSQSTCFYELIMFLPPECIFGTRGGHVLEGS